MQNWVRIHQCSLKIILKQKQKLQMEFMADNHTLHYAGDAGIIILQPVFIDTSEYILF